VTVALLLLGACGSDDDGAAVTTTTATHPASGLPDVLPLGKTDLELQPGAHQSPEGFLPTLSFELEQPAISVHRYADAFDVAPQAPDGSGPVLIAVFATLDADADAVAADLRGAGAEAGADVTDGQPFDTLGVPSTVLDLEGGAGEVFTSRDGSISLDAGTGPLLRFVITDLDTQTLVVAFLVPEGADVERALPAGGVLLRTLRLLVAR
jgi:hypothetical protein